jgi:glutathione S-transferase
MSTELLGLPYSPWSEKARWALEARGVPYASRLYQPLLGEPALRVKLRKFTGRVTVPVLTADGSVFADSADIARWADARGEGPTLFPQGADAEIARFVALSERGLDAGRGLALVRTLKSEEALLEMVPRATKKLLGRNAVRVAAFGIRRTLRKYGAAGAAGDALEPELTSVLDELRAAIASSPSKETPKTLLASFSFADIAMAQVLAFVRPPTFGLKIKPANRASWENSDLATRYADLVAWRDAIYEAHRPRAS